MGVGNPWRGSYVPIPWQRSCNSQGKASLINESLTAEAILMASAL